MARRVQAARRAFAGRPRGDRGRVERSRQPEPEVAAHWRDMDDPLRNGQRFRVRRQRRGAEVPGRSRKKGTRLALRRERRHRIFILPGSCGAAVQDVRPRFGDGRQGTHVQAGGGDELPRGREGRWPTPRLQGVSGHPQGRGGGVGRGRPGWCRFQGGGEHGHGSDRYTQPALQPFIRAGARGAVQKRRRGV